MQCQLSNKCRENDHVESVNFNAVVAIEALSRYGSRKKNTAQTEHQTTNWNYYTKYQARIFSFG